MTLRKQYQYWKKKSFLLNLIKKKAQNKSNKKKLKHDYR